MKTILTTFLLIYVIALDAQSFNQLDKSSLDLAYFPPKYAFERSDDKQGIIRVIYSRPLRKDREIFGDKVKYGKVWRTGANESTEIEIFKDITINGKILPAGRYSMFSIPGEKDWTIIFNSRVDYWGAFTYKEDKDVLRVTTKSSTTKKTIEAFTIQFKKNGKNEGVMQMAWENTLVEMEFTY